MRFGTALFGDSNFGVRSPGLAAMLAMQVLLADIVWRVVRDCRYVIAVVLMTKAAPDYGLKMANIAPDIALMPCEFAMIWSLVRLAQSSDQRWWLRPGCSEASRFGEIRRGAVYPGDPRLRAGAGLAQTAACQSLGLDRDRAGARRLFAGAIWNASHDWASFKFQLDRQPQISGWTPVFSANLLASNSRWSVFSCLRS